MAKKPKQPSPEEEAKLSEMMQNMQLWSMHPIAQSAVKTGVEEILRAAGVPLWADAWKRLFTPAV